MTGEPRAGNSSGIDDVEDLKKILADFSSRLNKEGKATTEVVRLSNIIKERIRTLDKLLKTPKTYLILF